MADRADVARRGGRHPGRGVAGLRRALGHGAARRVPGGRHPARSHGPREHKGRQRARGPHGGTGDDVLFGSARAEVLSGGDGNDLIVAAAGADLLIGDKGYDTLWGGGGDDTFIGDSGEHSPENGDDELAGGEDDDDLFGGPGDDVLVGGNGDDWLMGGDGDDTLTGGVGADTFVFEPHHGADTITDFKHGEDLIDLTEFAGVSRFGNLRLTAVKGATVIDLTRYGGDVIRLEDTIVSDFDAGTFELYGPPADDFAMDETSVGSAPAPRAGISHRVMAGLVPAIHAVSHPQT